MIAEAGDVIRQAIWITGFVFVMMLVIEYINVQTKGLWHTQFLGNGWKQYILALTIYAFRLSIGKKLLGKQLNIRISACV